jgi:hypothetical protein
MLGLLKRQEERALKEAKAASLRQPFEHAAKTSLEGVTSGSLIVRVYVDFGPLNLLTPSQGHFYCCVGRCFAFIRTRQSRQR